MNFISKRALYFVWMANLFVCLNGCKSTPVSPNIEDTNGVVQVTSEVGTKLSDLALRCIQREYPNKLDHVMNNISEVQSPENLHPAFYGCFDWHSSVHGHWMLIRLLKMVPGMDNEDVIRQALRANLTREKLLAETTYLDQPNRKSFERTYGWAWLLKLAEELRNWDDTDGKKWADNLQPLESAIVDRYLDFLPKQNYPIRMGVHPNTAFGLAFAWDYLQDQWESQKLDSLRDLVKERALTYYLADRDAPAEWEPGGEDFFSPVLMEADLMRRILPPTEFAKWLSGFLPGLTNERYTTLLNPAIVIDRTDPKLVHLDGLNLSRAWCMKGIASALPSNDLRKRILLKSAERHASAGLAQITSGNYEGEHWLGSFAVYLLQ